MRIGDIEDRIRALLRHTKSDEAICDEVEACLSQFDIIAETRDKMVHRRVNYDAIRVGLRVHNMLTARAFDKHEMDFFTLAEIKAMQNDANRIFLRLSEIAEPDPDLPDDERADMLAGLQRPWRYTRPKPAPQKKSPRKTRKARRRPPDASQG